MNKIEKEMLLILKKLKNENNVVGVKAEFEAEGTRIDELLRLMDIARKADVKIALKIGGCEAIKDLMECKQLGVDYIIAPMVETPYALTKFIQAKNKVYDEIDQEDTDFLFNVETITTFKNLNEMVEIAKLNRHLDGIVFGRVDFSGSMNQSRDNVNTNEILKYCLDTANLVKDTGLDLVVGGAISIDSLDILKKIAEVKLDRFETRKIIFLSEATKNKDIKQAMLDAVKFELLWLLSKKSYYQHITLEDEKRIQMLESRWKIL
jgi:hypothetical protein